MINQITYPRDTIQIKKKDPFEIIVSDSEEEYYIYPPISIKQDEYIAEISAICQKSIDERAWDRVISRYQTGRLLPERKIFT